MNESTAMTADLAARSPGLRGHRRGPLDRGRPGGWRRAAAAGVSGGGGIAS